MANHFYSSHYSIEHSKRRLGDLIAEITIFFKSNPYAEFTDIDMGSGQDVHKIKLVKPMPIGLQKTAFDAINSLRASLDQAGFSIAKAIGKSGRRAHFPFGDTPAEVESRIRGASQDLPQEIFDLMVSFQPYMGGNKFIWAMNKICNSHKHEIIIPTAICVAGGTIDCLQFGRVADFSFPPKWDSTKNEMILWVVPHGEKPHYNLNVQTFIAMGDIEGVRGQEAVGIINAMIGEVERILMALEAESRRLGYI